MQKVVPVLAQPKDFDGEYTAPAYGLDSLIAVMGEILPDELQKTLQNIQKVNLEEKKKKAYAAVAAAAAYFLLLREQLQYHSQMLFSSSYSSEYDCCNYSNFWNRSK